METPEALFLTKLLLPFCRTSRTVSQLALLPVNRLHTVMLGAVVAGIWEQFFLGLDVRVPTVTVTCTTDPPILACSRRLPSTCCNEALGLKVSSHYNSFYFRILLTA